MHAPDVKVQHAMMHRCLIREHGLLTQPIMATKMDKLVQGRARGRALRTPLDGRGQQICAGVRKNVAFVCYFSGSARAPAARRRCGRRAPRGRPQSASSGCSAGPGPAAPRAPRSPPPRACGRNWHATHVIFYLLFFQLEIKIRVTPAATWLQCRGLQAQRAVRAPAPQQCRMHARLRSLAA